MQSPLNSILYTALLHEFNSVVISNPGIAAQVTYCVDAMSNRTKSRLAIKGEYYRVSCPYCGDSRKRLWINHLWGVQDNVTNSKNLGLAICFNEDCLKEEGKVSHLYERILGWKNVNQRGITSSDIVQGEIEDVVLTAVELPGLTIPINKLPSTSLAVNYLRKRGYDIQELANTYDISYCIDAKTEYSTAHNRIVIPIYMNDMLVGWQCRMVTDKLEINKKVLKYYSRPGMPRRLMLYNYDTAKRYPYVIVCEGPTDVWRVGDHSVAAFGKHLSQAQLQLLSQTWEGGAIILLLDGDAAEDTSKLEERLRQDNYNGHIISLRLPDDKDPSDLSTSFLQDVIFTTAKRVGVNLLKLERRIKNDDKLSPRASKYRAIR